MHKSRLAGFIIDCKTDDLDGAAAFWTQALGHRLRPSSDPVEHERYRNFDIGPNGLHIEVQKVDHPSRVHLDIETNDIEAEVRRLEGLGAKRVNKGLRWWVMEAPTGQRFCVVRPQGPDFDATANVWD
jgi:predicted enzyme related to lactoylglutathione lyase